MQDSCIVRGKKKKLQIYGFQNTVWKHWKQGKFYNIESFAQNILEHM